MEKLTKKEYEKLINLVDEKSNIIRKESYSNENIAEEYHELGFIKIKLESQIRNIKE